MSERAYTLATVLEKLAMKRSTFFALRAQGKLSMIEELRPRLGRIVRFRADLIDAYVDGRFGDTRKFFARARRIAGVVIVAALMSAGHASADEHQRLNIATGVFLTAALTDGLMTQACIRAHRCREANPALSWAQDEPAAMFAVSKAVDVAGAWAVRRFIGRKHPKWASAGFYAFTGLRIYGVVKAAQILGEPRR